MVGGRFGGMDLTAQSILGRSKKWYRAVVPRSSPECPPRCRGAASGARRFAAYLYSLHRTRHQYRHLSRLSKDLCKLKGVYGLQRKPLREKDFRHMPEVLLLANIPDRIRTCNLRLRRPTRYPIVPRGHATTRL